MKGKRTRKASSDRLTRRQQEQLAAVAATAEADIDLSEIPEVRDWSGARRGVFYRPVKHQLTLRLDAEVVAWFRSQAPRGYQTAINRALREYVLAKGKRPRSLGIGDSGHLDTARRSADERPRPRR